MAKPWQGLGEVARVGASIEHTQYNHQETIGYLAYFIVYLKRLISLNQHATCLLPVYNFYACGLSLDVCHLPSSMHRIARALAFPQ
jgi:hypothetical protein